MTILLLILLGFAFALQCLSLVYFIIQLNQNAKRSAQLAKLFNNHAKFNKNENNI
jgi:hypothetical protein